MKDQVIICANCGSEFVFSEGEQSFYAKKGLETPRYCPICRSLKAQEKRIPAKPVKQTKFIQTR